MLGALRIVLDPHQRGDLVHTRRTGHLIGQDFVQSLGREDLDRVLVQLGPVALHLMKRRNLVRPEVVRHLGGLRAELDVERVAKRVRRVGAHHHCPVARGGAANGRRRGDRGLADATLTGEEDYPHPVSLRSVLLGPMGCVPRRVIRHVTPDQRFDVAKDLDRHFCVVLDRLEDLDILPVRLVGLVRGVLEGKTVLLGLAVAGQQEHRAGVSGLDRKEQVQKDERLRIEVKEEDRVAHHPGGDHEGLDDQERPGTDAERDLVRQPFAKRGLFVVYDVDRMLVVPGDKLVPAQGLFERGMTGVARANRHGAAETLGFGHGCCLGIGQRLRAPRQAGRENYLTISGTRTDPIPSRTTIDAATTSRLTRTLVKYGTRSRGIDGSVDSTVKRPPRPLMIWLRAPSDSSTDRTRAWSPPTRAWETLRTAPCVATGELDPLATGVSGPGGRMGCRNLPLERFLPLRLIDLQV